MKKAMTKRGGRTAAAGKRTASARSAHAPLRCNVCGWIARHGRGVVLPWLCVAALGVAWWALFRFDPPLEPVRRWAGAIVIALMMCAMLVGPPILFAIGLCNAIDALLAHVARKKVQP